MNSMPFLFSGSRLGLLALLLPASLLACSSSSSNSSSDDSGTGGSSGGGGSGGGTEGGSTSSGGGGSSGGSGGGTCLTGTVDFALHLSPAATTTYCLGPSGGCSGGAWLTILPADGGTELSQIMGCVPTCSSCQPVACSNLCIATPALGDGGVHTTWDGTYLEHTTCGASLACTNDECAPAGSYVARMCGYPEAADASVGFPCTSSTTPTCIDMPFTWPPATGTVTVEATIGGSAGAGASD
ncbi:MAG: hypothetical protein ACRENE_30355 [Polyangiaceae bacterium]